MISSTPNVQEYDPREIPWQFELIKDVRKRCDYALGTHEFLLSGSVGSGKSLPVAHIIATHVAMYPGANFGIGRMALGDLKDTLCQKLREHLHNSGIDHRYMETSGDFRICNGSKITAFSWHDKKWKKFGSHELSGMAIEEAQENEIDKAYEWAYARVGRLSHVPESIMLAAANPDSPAHWLAKRFKLHLRPPGSMDSQHPSPTRHVYYSRTEENKFLQPQYIEGLKTNMDPKLARRLIYGEWIEINSERIYHAYESDRNYRKDTDYVVDKRYPVRLAFDFNIGDGKPLSCVLSQHIDGTHHWFAEVIIEGMRTEDCMEEAASRGLLEHDTQYIVHGDASGRSRDTRNNRSDYDIIRRYLANYRARDGRALRFEIHVPKANPAIRTRHNLVNAACLNEHGAVRFYVYKGCPTLDEGMRLTALKKGAQLLEDDSKFFQHCTTAVGYQVVWIHNESQNKPQGTVEL
jgi:hypothetical protein